jgi:peptidoglycan/LPS O-acetylase OafA/YrhL
MRTENRAEPDNNFNLIRILGAFAVIYGHAYDLTVVNGPAPGILGHSVHTFGLIMFFSISGFLVMKSLDQSRGLADFLVKRIARIFPGLTVAILATTFVLGPLFSSLSVAGYFADGRTYSYLQNIGLLVTYSLPGVFESLPIASAVNGSLWTIPVEVACYLMLGFLLVRIRGKVARIVTLALVCFVLALVIERWVSDKSFFVFYGTDWFVSSTIMIFFFVGAVLYLVPKSLLRLDLAILLIFCSILFSQAPLYLSVVQPLFLTYSIVCLGTARSLLPQRFIGMGDPSYGAYLYAFPIQQVVISLDLFTSNIGLNILLVTLISFGLGYLSWHTIERPALLGARSFLKSRVKGVSSNRP